MSVNIQESFEKLSMGDKIMLIAGPLLLIDSFLKWYSYKACFLDVCVSGSRSGLAVARGAVVDSGGAHRSAACGRYRRHELREREDACSTAGCDMGPCGSGRGCGAALFILLKLLGESSHLGYGFFIGIILVAALVVGAGLNFQAEREGKGGATTSSM